MEKKNDLIRLYTNKSVHVANVFVPWMRLFACVPSAISINYCCSAFGLTVPRSCVLSFVQPIGVPAIFRRPSAQNIRNKYIDRANTSPENNCFSGVAEEVF